MISIVLTGYYSNYLIIVSAIKTTMENLFSSFTASLGNLNVEENEDTEKKYQVFKTLNFLNFWLYGFCGVCLFVLFEPFIKIWIGEKYTLGLLTETVIVLDFLVIGLQETIGTHRAAYGLFYAGRYRPIFSNTLNIILSIVFVLVLPDKYGVVAVLLGTILSNLGVGWWYDALIVHKHAFKKSPVQYYFNYVLRLIYLGVLAGGIKKLCWLIQISPLVDFILYGIISTIVYNGLFILVFRKRVEFQYFERNLRHLLKKIKQ
jgi:Na+-driven multidrug efflux pump